MPMLRSRTLDTISRYSIIRPPMHIETTRTCNRVTRTCNRVTRNAIANAIRGPSRSQLARKILARTRNALDSRCIVSVGRYCMNACLHKLARQLHVPTHGAVVFFHSPTNGNYLRTTSPGRDGHSWNWLIHDSKSNCIIQNKIVLCKIKLRYSKFNCVIQNQIVFCEIKSCYAKSNCVIQNQIVLCEIKLGYSNSRDINMSVRTIEFVFQLSI